jgi:uncharacterized membrane protein YcaP (DUF421 family)
MPENSDSSDRSRASGRPGRRSRLQLQDDVQFQVREWRAQRVGLVALVALIAASAAGLLGSPQVILRVVAIYGFLLVVLRIAGKRTVAQMTSFDLIVLLVIGDATQQALIGEDYTVGTAVVAVSCLVLVDVGLGKLKSASPRLDRLVDGMPLILVAHGKLLEDRMAVEGVDLEDILTSAREQHGLGRLEDIDYAVLERHGGLSIIPKRREENS